MWGVSNKNYTSSWMNKIWELQYLGLLPYFTTVGIKIDEESQLQKTYGEAFFRIFPEKKLYILLNNFKINFLF
jgi:hypothetical protein